jgi:hypothetical protein
MPKLRMLLRHGLERYRRRLAVRTAKKPPHQGGPASAVAGIFPFDRGQTIPISSAFSTARVRSRTPSFDKMLETWFFTVPSATFSELAISLLL